MSLHGPIEANLFLNGAKIRLGQYNIDLILKGTDPTKPMILRQHGPFLATV